jgi:fumarate reductase flavoprotein subunit
LLAVAGAGMAGLCAAARARELGAETVVLEKGDRPGGSMLLSSGVIWRHRTFEEFRAECPSGDERLQRLIFDRLDEALDWLESLGAPVVARETGNALTAGRRVDARGLTEALVRRAGEVRFETPFPALVTQCYEGALVLATGGFPVRFARERGLPLRANPWSEGAGLDHARSCGAGLTTGMDEFYGRAMPDAPFGEADFVGLSQLYGRYAVVVDKRGEQFFTGPVSWSENDLAQAIARQHGGAAWYLLDEEALSKRVRERTVGEMVEAARAAGGTVVPPEALPFQAPPDTVVAVRVRAAVTHTIGGLRIDDRARILRDDGSGIPNLYAAGVDVGGWSTGGYASGLAAALVLGVTAAESAVAGL